MSLFLSIYRVFNPPIDSTIEEIEHLAEKTAGKTEKEIELFVKRAFPYQYDWQTYSLPWYFPTTKEAITKRKGDCKTRFIITASIFEYRKMPYSILASPTHIWIDYAGREENSSENKKIAIISSNDEGKSILTSPKEINWKNSSRSFWKGFWKYMPSEKKSLLLFNLGISFLFIFFPKYLEKYFWLHQIKKVE